MKCAQCDKEIESVKGCAVEEAGWVLPRTGGGTHHLMKKRKTGRVLCREHTTNMVYGVDENQLTLT